VEFRVVTKVGREKNKVLMQNVYYGSIKLMQKKPYFQSLTLVTWQTPDWSRPYSLILYLIHWELTEPFKLGNKVLIQWGFRLVTKVAEKNKVLIQKKITTP